VVVLVPLVDVVVRVVNTGVVVTVLVGKAALCAGKAITRARREVRPRVNCILWTVFGHPKQDVSQGREGAQLS